VSSDGLLQIRTATVAKFECVLVKYFVQWVFAVEYIFYQLEEYGADFRLYITAIRWVVPDDSSLSYGFDACIVVIFAYLLYCVG